MKRREFLRKTVAAGAAMPMLGADAHIKQPDRPMNILFLMDDQHRGDCVGAEGADWVDTPNLDRLAREGMLFRKAYTSLPSCLPARASLLTGKSPWGHGLLCYAPMADRYENEKPRMLTDAGYRTHAVGKMHFQSHSHGYESIVLQEAWRGRKNGEGLRCDYRKWFEANYPDKDVDQTGLGYTDHNARAYLYDEELHPTNWTARQAVDFLETYDGEQPWFLKVSFIRPHPPFDPPKRLFDRYLGKDLPKAQVGAWAEQANGEFVGSVEATPNAPRGKYPDDEIHRSRAGYYALITYVDEQVGKILVALEARGELEDTLILFTSDHGDMMGDQHLWRKTYAYEGSARVPMIVRWPEKLDSTKGIERGRTSDNLVELRDVLPTFLEVAGVERPADMDGMSLLDIVRGKDRWREVLDLEHGSCYWPENAWVALTDGRYKYIYFTLTGQQQLFDLDNDPHELNDLAESEANADLVESWRKRMYDHLAVRGEPWVKDGGLAVQTESMRYAPHHPKETTA